MKTRLNRLITSVTAGAVVAAFAVSAQGKLLVTEFIADPSGTDADREWIEIFNSGPVAIDLTDYKVGDEENQGDNEGMYRFLAGTMMTPGQVYVIAVKATGFFSLYGKNPDFETSSDTDASVPNMTQYTSWGTGLIALANTGDHALILDPFDQILDGANYGGVTKFFTGGATLGSNESYERKDATVDTDTASDWLVHASGLATPGTVIPEPSAVALGLLAASLLVIRRRV